MTPSRREFLRFLGRAGVVGLGVSTLTLDTLQAIGLGEMSVGDTLKGIQPSDLDEVVLAKGLTYSTILKWGDAINAKDSFGSHNDYLAYLPLDPAKPLDGLLWANHESLDPRWTSGWMGGERTQAQVDKEMDAVGGSIVRIRKEKDKWVAVKNDRKNRRLTAHTMIPLHWDSPIMGTTTAMGTLANCAGGVTPWGTILTCEEDYDTFFGERDYSSDKTKGVLKPSKLGWERFYNNPPEHYGWVVEINPQTGDSRKLIALGRFMHECATVQPLADGRVVIYMGDDANDEHLYKYISASPQDLKDGTLYVADLSNGRWMPVSYETQPLLKSSFSSQTEVLLRCREAAKLLGATPLDRPEDIDIDPLNGAIYITLTNNKPKNNYHGSILKIEEDEGDYAALTFSSSTFMAGGEETGFTCPDNLAFDPQGNLWFTSDMSGMHQAPYTAFKNNGLFLIPSKGRNAGKVMQIASAPKDAEFTGPWFAPDGTLFLSVQHPGEQTKNLAQPTSRWPNFNDNIPRSAVIAIYGLDLA